MKEKRIKYLKLRYLREKLGCKQVDFARLIGVTSGQYGKKENGVQPWDLKECMILRDYINKELKKKGEAVLTIDEIFFEDCVSNKTQKVAI